jgi:hypothetical protein
MTVSAELTEQVRSRADFACEFCGVTEVDTGGLLTVDHYRPRSRGGTDDFDNLVYCCFRCNVYKGDYWPERADDLMLWHPRREPLHAHLLELADGRLFPITPTGELTLRELYLNRPELIEYRLGKREWPELPALAAQNQELLQSIQQLQRRITELVDVHRAQLQVQNELLRRLLNREGS